MVYSQILSGTRESRDFITWLGAGGDVVALSAGDVKLFVGQTMRDPRKEHCQSVSLLVVSDISRKGGSQSLGPIPSY